MAGGKAKPEFVAATGVENRALMRVGDGTMLERVLAALRGAPVVAGVTVVGDVPDAAEYDRLPDHGGFVENLFAGIERSREAPYVLVSTADIPFITAEAVEDFVARGRETGADIVYPIVEVERCYARFPGVKRTAASLRDGRYTGGNMVLLRPEFMLRQRRQIADAYAARKSPLRLARMLGFRTTLRAAVALSVWPRALGVAELEGAVGRLLGGKARALVSPFPEIATDIDRPSDLEAIREAAPPAA